MAVSKQPTCQEFKTINSGTLPDPRRQAFLARKPPCVTTEKLRDLLAVSAKLNAGPGGKVCVNLKSKVLTHQSSDFFMKIPLVFVETPRHTCNRLFLSVLE